MRYRTWRRVAPNLHTANYHNDMIHVCGDANGSRRLTGSLCDYYMGRGSHVMPKLSANRVLGATRWRRMERTTVYSSVRS